MMKLASEANFLCLDTFDRLFKKMMAILFCLKWLSYWRMIEKNKALIRQPCPYFDKFFEFLCLSIELQVAIFTESPFSECNRQCFTLYCCLSGPKFAQLFPGIWLLRAVILMYIPWFIRESAEWRRATIDFQLRELHLKRENGHSHCLSNLKKRRWWTRWILNLNPAYKWTVPGSCVRCVRKSYRRGTGWLKVAYF